MEKVKDLTLLKVAKEVGIQTIVFLGLGLGLFSQHAKDVFIWLLWCVAILGIWFAIMAACKPETIKERWTNKFAKFELYTGILLSMQLVYYGYMVLPTVLLISHIFVCNVMSNIKIRG